MITFIYHLDVNVDVNGLPQIIIWKFTEAQTGRGWIDIHFAYFELSLKSFLEYGNNIILEEHLSLSLFLSLSLTVLHVPKA